MSASLDRNLLFGVLALQMDFVDRDRLIEAMSAWVTRKETPLGALLEERGSIRPEDRELLENLVDAHVARHGNDPRVSLRSLRSIESARDTIYPVADDEVRESLTILPSSSLSAEAPESLGGRTVMTLLSGESAAEGPSGIASLSTRFTVLRPHAEGGLGKVSVALDRELNRRVAFKEIKHERHAEDPGVRARFVVEAEITGKLEHPGVVPVYSLGADDRGRPYYAMRFIQGNDLQHAIDRYHDPKSDSNDKPRDLLNLLRRFLDVCDVTSFAHRKGVLHRDIKPSNVLLGEYGETIVVDWGIAKLWNDAGRETAADDEAIHTSISGDDSYETRPGSRVGTPGFMSPEQAAGTLDKVGPWSDVYSLGAMLYVVLTGRPPFIDPSVEIRLLKTIRGEFPKPRELRPDSPRPLEAICLRAMALEPEARYASVKQLAEDVEKYLADEPISIYSDPLLVRARRWSRRHKTAFAAGLAATIIAAFGLAATAYLQSEASRRERGLRLISERETAAANLARADAVKARAEAEREAEHARSEAKKSSFLSSFMIALFQSADPIGLEGRGLRDGFESVRELKATQVLERGAKRVTDPKLLADADPLAVAALADAIGNSLRSAGEFEKAKPLLEKSLNIRRERLKETDRELGESHFHMAILRHDHREFASAEDHYRRALRALADDPDASALVKFRLAWMYAELRRITEAEALYKEVLAAKSARPEADELELRAIRLGMFMLMVQNHGVKDRDRLIKELTQAMPDVINGALTRAFLAYVQADGLRRTGRHGLAKPRYEEALKLLREYLPSRHIFLAALLADMAGFYRDAGELPRAEELVKEALDIGRRVMPTHPYMIEALLKYSEELTRNKRPEEAESVLVEAVEYAKKRAAVATSDLQWKDLLVRLIKMKTDQGRPAEAEAYRRRFEGTTPK